MQWHSGWKHGLTLYGGGIGAQPQWYVELMHIIDAEIAALEREAQERKD